MSSLRFTEQALSDWMRCGGSHSEIVISSRMRIARNLEHLPFPLLASAEQAEEALEQLAPVFQGEAAADFGTFQLLKLDELDELDKKVLVEKHLISPNLANDSRGGAVILNEDESVSIMINEEDHLRIQCLFPGLQVKEAWVRATAIDDIFEASVNYAFDDRRGYLTSCPTNVGTGLRASVMLHS